MLDIIYITPGTARRTGPDGRVGGVKPRVGRSGFVPDAVIPRADAPVIRPEAAPPD